VNRIKAAYVARRAITEATQPLPAGKPLRSSGRLDTITLAEEAGLKRTKLTHKHTGLKDLFNAERRARDGVPDSELRLRDQIAAMTKKIKALKQERDQYRTASQTFASNKRPHHRERQPPPGHAPAGLANRRASAGVTTLRTMA